MIAFGNLLQHLSLVVKEQAGEAAGVPAVVPDGDQQAVPEGPKRDPIHLKLIVHLGSAFAALKLEGYRKFGADGPGGILHLALVHLQFPDLAFVPGLVVQIHIEAEDSLVRDGLFRE